MQACVALGVVAVVRAVDFALRQWSIGLVRSIPDEGAGPELMAQLETADRFIDTNNVAILVTFVVTAILYLRWLHGIVTLTLALGGALSWRPAQAVWSFFIPFANFVRPYQAVLAVREALDPKKVAPPGPRVDPSAQVDYRSTPFVEPTPAPKLPPAPVGAWWGGFLVMSIGARLSNIGPSMTNPQSVITAYHGAMVVSFAAVVAATLAIVVVRGLTARAEERFRCIRESSPEALAAQNIVLR